MRVEICHRISDGYSGSPDLRLTWLKIIAERHRANHSFAQAAQVRGFPAHPAGVVVRSTCAVNCRSIMLAICPCVAGYWI
jgi:hypothetical protein